MTPNRFVPEVMTTSSKLFGLEIIRFLSSLSVLVWHYQHFSMIAHKPVDFIKEQQPFYGVLRLFYEYGYHGVQVFWCISGFIFFWKYRGLISSRAISWKQFFMLRFSRLYPLHFVTLLLVMVLQFIYFSHTHYFFVYPYNDASHFVLQLFLASYWGFEQGFSFNGPIWSVSVEVLIYCFFFIVLRYVGSSVLVNLLVLVGYLIARYHHLSNPIVDCLAFFYLGGLSSMAFLYFDATTHRKRLQFLALAMIWIIPILVYFFGLHQQKYFVMLFLMSYVPILLFYGANKVRLPRAMARVIEVAGNMTYSSYLLHFPIQLMGALCFFWLDKDIPYYNNVFFLGFILSTLVASFYTYRLFELPAQDFIRKKSQPDH